MSSVGMSKMTKVAKVASKVEIIIQLASSSLRHTIGMEIRCVGLAATSEMDDN